MSIGPTDAAVTSPARRPRATKAPKGTSRPSAGRPKKVSFYLSPEALKRIGIHATMMDTDRSAVVEQLVNEHLRRWVVSDRARSADQGTEATQESIGD
jgi:hypothetical protein